MEPCNWKQFHPIRQTQYKQQITAYKLDNKETFIDWDDPYKNLRPWKIIDFLRNFELTK